VSVNVGYAPHSTQDVLSLLECFHAQIRADPRLMLADSTADVARAVEDGRIAVAFDLEDSNPLDGDWPTCGASTTAGCAPCCPPTTTPTPPVPDAWTRWTGD